MLSVRPTRHIVITVHGIRTFGRWQERLEGIIRSQEPDVQFSHYKYGFFPAIAYAVPLLRWREVRRFARELLRQADQYPASRIDLVAHSFGTHLVGWGLKRASRNRSLRINTVILAASVLKERFPWGDLLSRKVVRAVMNECGVDDVALLLNKIIIPFMGAAGRNGFDGTMTNTRLRNNYYKCGHSGYFRKAGRWSDEFMKWRWSPALLGEELPPHVDERSEGWTNGLLAAVSRNASFVQIAICALLLATVVPAFYHLYSSAVEARRTVLAQRLTQDAQAMMNQSVSYPSISALLAIEAMRLHPSEDNDRILRRVLPFLRPAASFAVSPTFPVVLRVSPDRRLIGMGFPKVTSLDLPVLRLFAQMEQKANRMTSEESSRAFSALQAREDSVTAISSDGQYVATGNADGAVQVFKAFSGKEIFHFRRKARVTALAVSSTGRYIAAGFSNGAFQLCDSLNGYTCAVDHYSDAVSAVGFSGNQRLYLVVSGSKKVRVFSVATRQPVFTTDTTGMTRSCALNPSGSLLAVGSGRRVALYRIANGNRPRWFGLPKGTMGWYTLAFTPNTDSLAISWQGNLEVMDVTTGKVSETVGNMPNGYMVLSVIPPPVAFGGGGANVAIPMLSGSVSVYDVNSTEELQNLTVEDLLRVYFSFEASNINTMELATARLKSGGLGRVVGLAFAEHGRYLVVVYDYPIQGKRFANTVILSVSDILVARYVLRPGDLIAEACSLLTNNLSHNEWREYVGREQYEKICPNLPSGVRVERTAK